MIEYKSDVKPRIRRVYREDWKRFVWQCISPKDDWRPTVAIGFSPGHAYNVWHETRTVRFK